MIIEKIMLDMLTTTSVSVVKQKYYKDDNGEYPIGEPWRRAYNNSPESIGDLKAELEEPYLSVVLQMWKGGIE